MLRADAASTGVLQCEAFGEGCSFLLAAVANGRRDALGDVVPTTGEPSDSESCPSCGGDLVMVTGGHS